MIQKLLLKAALFFMGPTLFAAALDSDKHQRPIVKRFCNARLLLNHEIKEGELWVMNGKIVSPQKKADLSVDVEGAIIAPGFIDLQINGAFGCDFSRNPEDIDQVAKRLPHYGVTSFLPTVISSSPEQYRAILPWLQPKASTKQTAAILGIHLEGPHFSPSYHGAHNKQFLQPSFEGNGSIEKVYGSLQGVKLITLAPELPGSLQVIRELRKKGVFVSAGHSNATFDQMKAAIEAGIGLATHLFNAMPGFHHRNPGIIGAALIEPSLSYSLIADGVHLSPETLSLCWRCNPEGLVLISDATEALGLPSGKYQLGTMGIEVENERVYLVGTKTIAGSALSLDKAVRRLRAVTRCSIAQALEAASLKPAKLIQIYPSKGTLETGADADFLILTDELYIRATYIGGELYEEPKDLKNSKTACLTAQ